MNYPCLSSRLIGRSYDMAALRSRMTGTADAALQLFGEAGAGNSALLDALAAELGREGVCVLRASGAQFETDIGYSGLNQLLCPCWTPAIGTHCASRWGWAAARRPVGSSSPLLCCYCPRHSGCWSPDETPSAPGGGRRCHPAARAGDGVPGRYREDIVTVLSAGDTFAHRSHRALYF
ncbi:hypothetical protein [Streptomyces sp. CB01249]|uniref:hypothetical protein n=1 Tax=Streptomyces sp. CB01249 TaxID=1703929 RepID=UPI001F526AAB|nr:hypothetical protein [Streptomyces sp. CB01249]